ncbi:MAG: hypothetical protein JO320_07710 [Alphaproteobacteria bacterium]|nr:hypothetical protein [Alphaproteobacteria bacterium]
MTPLTFLAMLLTAPRPKSCSLMSVFKLANEHPLTKAGLRCVRVVEKAELGLTPSDVVFEFPFGRIVDTGMACRSHGIIPAGVDILMIHREATAVRAACIEQGQAVTRTNVLPYRRRAV